VIERGETSPGLKLSYRDATERGVKGRVSACARSKEGGTYEWKWWWRWANDDETPSYQRESMREGEET
jgi:hypothetical protein